MGALSGAVGCEEGEGEEQLCEEVCRRSRSVEGVSS